MKPICKTSFNTNTDEKYTNCINRAHNLTHVGSSTIAIGRPLKNNCLRIKPALFLIFVLLLGFTAKAQYATIDNHVKSIVVERKDDVQTLAKKITARSSTELEKVRAIFMWIVSNVEYDVRSYMSGRIPDSEPMNVARVKSAVCQGYSNLFEALCKAEGIQAFVVSGFSKGYGFTNRTKLENADHAWNAVKADGKWYVLDATWASGHLNQRGKYVKSFQEKYFLANPTIFITEHLPEDPAWQLLNCPITPNEFLKDSAQVRKIAESKKLCYNYTDTLNQFVTLDMQMQKVATAKRMVRFFPENTYTAAIMVNQVAYEYSATLSNQATPLDEKMQAARKSQKYYQMAYEMVKKARSDSERQVQEIVKKNLKNVNDFIQFYENQ